MLRSIYTLIAAIMLILFSSFVYAGHTICKLYKSGAECKGTMTLGKGMYIVSLPKSQTFNITCTFTTIEEPTASYTLDYQYMSLIDVQPTAKLKTAIPLDLGKSVSYTFKGKGGDKGKGGEGSFPGSGLVFSGKNIKVTCHANQIGGNEPDNP